MKLAIDLFLYLLCISKYFNNQLKTNYYDTEKQRSTAD